MPEPNHSTLKMSARLALARLLSKAARNEGIDADLASLPQSSKHAYVIAVTGSAGVGKSSLIGRLLSVIRNDHKTVAVLACDPESPRTGGALLGDRFRLAPKDSDDGIFIRSLATPSGRESIAANLEAMIRILERFGFDVIVIETVGAGQGDVAVRELADRTVLLVQPETGDDLQWEKAGIIEVADVVVVNKADLPGADQTEAQVKAILGLGDQVAAPVLRVSAKRPEDATKLWSVLRELPSRSERPDRAVQELLRRAHRLLDERWREAVRGQYAAWKNLLERNGEGKGDEEQAAAALLRLASEPPMPEASPPCQ